ncbi:hypothetical protein ONE63_003869 [Megalurothrips usitatus]|uniref:CCAAT-binding factor domain-containing protein n=1 Tax=Megalurothrips usitatus TaxID=439358 RepID=A0AAV7X6Y9_9NEOP|nr:hypothetical protein ONE63_003869 [Megalurothrips usitatus]
MAASKVSKKLHSMAIDFLSNRRNANNIADIIALLESNESNIQPCFLALEVIFVEVLKRREMYQEQTTTAMVAADAESQYKAWLRECYEDVWGKLLAVISNSLKISAQAQAFSTAMKLIAMEGQNPLEPLKKEEHYFPSHRLRALLMVLLSSGRNSAPLLARLQEFSSYPDVLSNVWKQLFPIAIGLQRSGQRPDENFIRNFLDLIDKFPLPKPGRGERGEDHDLTDNLLCGQQGHNGYILNMDHMRKAVNKVWGCVMHWNHTPATQRMLLVVLLERVLPFLDKPLLLTDYLMDSLDSGGAVSLLALQGIFTLIQNHNLEYPNIFSKLYSMFEPEIFHTKFKARLFYLSDMFLSSSHLPENIVAAFAKRLARLSLVAPPEDIHIILMFIGNLILRHPGLKLLIDNPNRENVPEDPFVMEERDPSKSRAMESSLWELYSLQSHVLPGVGTAANFIYNPLPSVEWDLSQILEENSDDIFEREMKKKLKEIALTFDRPQTLSLPQHERVSQFWQLV